MECSLLFYILGHSYELVTEEDWAAFEDFCKMISNKSDIWYCTNIEVIDGIEKIDFRGIIMIYKNVLFHNVAEIIDNGDGSISWSRVPDYVRSGMEGAGKGSVEYDSTGVEIRFVLKSGSAVIRMCTHEKSAIDGIFHIYRGSLQGSWNDHEVKKTVDGNIKDYVIENPNNMEHLKEMTKECGYDWDAQVIRIIFDRGRFKIYDIVGDIEPPKPEQLPQKTILSYGSSITHGSNSIDMSHSWVSLLAYNLNMDAINLGMSGSCAIEPEMAEYIATEGEKENWDIATLELGINVLGWEEEKIINRVSNIISVVASRNKDKPIFVISPFYHCGEHFHEAEPTAQWRRVIEEVVNELNYPNVWYFNGLDILDNMSYISADEVHPNIQGVQRIADVLTKQIKTIINS